MTRQVVERYIQALNHHDPDAIAACVTPDFHNEHTSVAGTSLRGRDAYRERLPTFLGQFTDLRYEIEDLIVDGWRAAVPYRMSFHHDGRPVVIRGMFRFTVADGLIAHRVDYWDGADFARQTS
ncbi:nuclear transport factor 2 family protein [Sphaerimonospora cavernae]|uniref:Nuclear transport factor 2 family protein n=1 Tax=Sphaerimonospora cavernae TaxID=1740611 RepID=A0ABV6U2Q0_9ACTN